MLSFIAGVIGLLTLVALAVSLVFSFEILIRIIFKGTVTHEDYHWTGVRWFVTAALHTISIPLTIYTVGGVILPLAIGCVIFELGAGLFCMVSADKAMDGPSFIKVRGPEDLDKLIDAVRIPV